MSVRKSSCWILSSLAVAAALVASLVVAAPASADPTSTDVKTSVMVSQLAVTDGTGYITIQAHIGFDGLIGFEATVPAGSGTWMASPDHYINQLGVHCVGLPGPALDYQCGANLTTAWEGRPNLPTGNYQVTLPVKRTGPVTGLQGQASGVRLSSYGEPFQTTYDMFPVVDGGTHFRSTVEVATLSTARHVFAGPSYGDLAETVTIVPGEQVMAIDSVLPIDADVTSWRLLHVAQNPGLTCTVGVPAGGSVTVHCVWLSGGRPVPIPPQRFTVSLQLRVTAPAEYYWGAPGSVALQVGTAPAETVDTFLWYNNLIYEF